MASQLEQHVALSVAAALAYQQLVSAHERAKPYDVEHYSAMVNFIAQALCRLAPLYVDDGGAHRRLTDAELGQATIRRGATLVELADGRRFSRATLRRGELRDAIAILKAVRVERFAEALERSPAGAPEKSTKR